ncbi:MAG TPA: ABC transporter ATP-binding protein [Thermoanaerobaculia bacterium]|nr:ABC transporter ATP-binding protein [Thermoanaerobaculia bacterium]
MTKLYRRYGRKKTVGTLKSALLSGLGVKALAPDDAVAALTGVSFEVASGESVGMIGANGSGKSTLLKLLSGILKPTEGEVSVRGRLAALLELGAGFHPEISGRENILINGLLLGLSKREIAARFDAIVRFAELTEFLDAPVKTYSSGMAVRLGFSIAAHSDPDVLLVDEVLAVGDEAFAHRCLEKFAEFERAGRTLVFVSHDLSLVAERCRRAIWLDRGRVAFDGPAAETVARYRERVAQQEERRRLEGTPSRPASEGGPAPAPPKRIGSGAASVESVRLLDAAGQPAARVVSGEATALEMAVRASRPVSDFVFGFAINTVSGAPVFGSNTEIDGFRAGELAGEARAILHLPACALGPGVYSVDAAVHARDGSPYDYRRDILRFEVTAERAATGVWNPLREWRFSGGVRWRT